MELVSPDTWGILTVIQEASGQPFEGKVAVAEVIQRRTKLRYFSHGTVASTVLWPAQFSGWNTKDPNRIRVATMDESDPEVRAAIQAWTAAKIRPPLVPDAVCYYNPAVVATPDWANKMEHVATIGAHVFYREKLT